MRFRKFLKTWILLIAMLSGMLFHNYIGFLRPVTPWLIFAMLTITFTRIKPAQIRISGFHAVLLIIQLTLCWVAYAAIAPFSREIASGIFLCIFISTATGAPVITSLLGGNIATLVSYSLLSSLTFAACAPIFLSFISDYGNFTFMESFSRICIGVLPLLLGPLALALILGKVAPKARDYIAGHQTISLYLWSIALIIVIGNAVSFALSQPHGSEMEMTWLAFGALAVCCLQFFIGRKVGKRFGDPVAGAQGLGQKNTILAIWVAMTYLHPITSLAPASYVLWQNLINSGQMWLHNRREDA